MGMVRIEVCSKCGEIFEVDSCSTESICPRCQMDDTDEDMALLNFYPELWANNIMESGKWR